MSSVDGAGIVIVVPCYNEAARLPVAALQAAVAALPRVRFLFVDDGSTDGTRAALDALAATVPSRAAVLALARNVGKGEAVRQGMRTALADGARVVGFWDADLAAPLTAVPDFLALLDQQPEIMVVLGSRIRRLGAEIERTPLRHYLGRAFATLASVRLGLPVYDTQCGAKLFRAGPALHAALAQPFTSRWAFDVEFLGRLEAAGLDLRRSAVEYPLRRWQHVRGSKLTPASALAAAWELLLLDLRRPPA